jgi:hypothetical protein
MNAARGNFVRKAGVWRMLAQVLALIMSGCVMAQSTPPPATAGTAAPTMTEKVGFDALKGNWVRPDGGYTIMIRNISPTGQIEAMYFNPNPLPFARAQAAQAGGVLRVSFELRAGGYDGSTYELTYDPAIDRLSGVYYQAVAKEKFDVYFVRRR